jgi:hypothetical protein
MLDIFGIFIKQATINYNADKTLLRLNDVWMRSHFKLNSVSERRKNIHGTLAA